MGEDQADQTALDDLSELSLRILELFARRERLTAPEIQVLTGANPNTLKVRLRELVAAGRLQRHGKARATWYSA